MASERDIELLDDYLSNRLDPDSRAAFEDKLKTDPTLQNELELQQQFIRGIRNARVAELKSMMNNIPVPPASTGAGIAAKVAIFTAVTGVVGMSLYFYLAADSNESAPTREVEQVEPTITEEIPEEADKAGDQSAVVPKETSSAGQRPVTVPPPVEDKAEVPLSEPAQPKVEVYDPSEETEDEGSVLTEIEGKPGTWSHRPTIDVVVDAAQKKYDFHYQFKDGKLFLYGSLQKDLYEILEIFSDEKRTMFLYHEHQYYLLKDGSEKITPLNPIEDPTLIKKLNEYRN